MGLFEFVQPTIELVSGSIASATATCGREGGITQCISENLLAPLLLVD